MPKNKQKKQKKQQKENNKQINNENNENNENNVESGCPECDGCLAKKKYDIAIKEMSSTNDTFIAEQMLLEASKHITKLMNSDKYKEYHNINNFKDKTQDLYKKISLNLHSIYYVRVFTSTTSFDTDIYKLLASTYLLTTNKYEPKENVETCTCKICIEKDK